MDSFLRAIWFAWPYRLRMLASVASGLVVAVFWGANISAIYPLVTVLLENKSLVDWVDERTEQLAAEIERTQVEISLRQSEWESETDVEEKAEIAAALARRQDLLAERQSERARYLWFRPYLESVAPSTPFATLCLLMAVVMLGMMVKSVFDYLQESLSGQVVQRAIFDLRRSFYRRTIALDLAHFSETQTHDLLAHFTSDLDSLSSGMKALLGKVLLEPLKAISCLAFACMFNWRLTVATLLLFPLGAILVGTVGRLLKRLSRRNLESNSRLYKILQETFQGVRVVKAFTSERRERLRLFHESKKNYRQSMRLVRTEAIAGPMLELLSIGGICFALLAGGYLVLMQKTHILGVRLTYDPMTPGLLMTFYALLIGMSDPIRKTFSVYGRVQRGVAAAERIFRCMDREPSIRSPHQAPRLARHRHSLEFRGVSFSYGRQKVLADIRLRVNYGETLAIVGPTGCGKTTLVNLVPRFYDPTAGAVAIDGQDLREVNLHSLRSQIGLVTQNTILFDDTIYRNIAYGSPHADRAAVIEAATAAYAHRFIEALPHGYDTAIGEMGAALSGGQRQRIALARAILRDPAILVLDEATSSLDVESEALIHKALESFKHGRTILMVTHRLSTLAIADRVAILAAGRLEAVGTHEELLDKSLTYRRLQEVQLRSA